MSLCVSLRVCAFDKILNKALLNTNYVKYFITKESSAFREIPVVIMSSENIQPRIEQCMTEGAEDFLLKPVKLADVKRLKELIMRGGEAEQETTSNLIISSPKRILQNNFFFNIFFIITIIVIFIV
ncbi:hypothetical protein DY000_02063914 [Brassica cretica]|uniref:Response regulatory domain-containing protein n=1 Tax=Brassica cretica TaxID=69181 RepID=A0ABQ7AR08_BRACR|nr:hypothetical protein DY000_02063914 [Brassica cretica]